MTNRPAEIVVIGGGLAGLTAGLMLARGGARVRLIRRGQGRVGSLQPSATLPGWRIEAGAPSVTNRAHAVFRLADAVGLGPWNAAGGPWQQLSPQARDRYVADGDRLRPVGVGTLGLRQAAVFGRGMVRHRPPEVAETVADWARRQFGPTIANGLARALTVGIWGCGPEHIGFADAWPELFAGLQTSSPMGLQKRMAGPGPTSAPTTGTWSLARGMGSLALATEEALLAAGGTIREEAVGGVNDVDADAIVVATDATDAAGFVRGTDPEAAALLDQVLHSPMAVVHWLAEPQERPRGFGFLVPPPDPVMGTLFMSDLRDLPGEPWAPPGLRAYATMMGGLAHPEWLDRPDAELVAEVTARHARWFGAEPQLRASHVVRWPRAVSIPSLGHRGRMRALCALELGRSDRRPLVYAGSYLAGGTLDDAVASGFDAARRLGALV